jgi:hypothetical protein
MIREFNPSGRTIYARDHKFELPNGKEFTLKMPEEDELLQIRHMLLEEVKRQNEEGNAI